MNRRFIFFYHPIIDNCKQIKLILSTEIIIPDKKNPVHSVCMEFSFRFFMFKTERLGRFAGKAGKGIIK